MSFKDNLHPLLRRERKDDKYDDPHYAVLTAIQETLKTAETDTINARLQSSLKTASGIYLEEWASWFGLRREPNESDRSLRERTITVINIPTGTNNAIVLAIKAYLKTPFTGVRITENWRRVFWLNRSQLNSEDHMMGNVYNVAVIEIRISSAYPVEIVRVIDEHKPAGVTVKLVYDPTIPPDFSSIPYFKHIYIYNTDKNIINEMSLYVANNKVSAITEPYTEDKDVYYTLIQTGDDYYLNTTDLSKLNNFSVADNDIQLIYRMGLRVINEAAFIQYGHEDAFPEYLEGGISINQILVDDKDADNIQSLSITSTPEGIIGLSVPYTSTQVDYTPLVRKDGMYYLNTTNKAKLDKALKDNGELQAFLETGLMSLEGTDFIAYDNNTGGVTT